MLVSPKGCWFKSKSQTWTWTPYVTIQAREPTNIGVAKEEKKCWFMFSQLKIFNTIIWKSCSKLIL
jgi:hypothetical protein